MTYDQTILALSPSSFWKFTETSGATATDSGGTNTGTYQGTTVLKAPGITDRESAVALDGSTTWISTATQFTNPGGPYTLEVWFKSTNGYASGGGLFQFSDSQTSTSAAVSKDRQVWMDNTGKLVFAIWIGSALEVTSTSAYNDGAWHLMNATLASNNNMTLYVDGVLAASNANTTAAANFNGWWRWGHGNFSGWTNSPTSNFFAGTLAKAAIYSSVLSAAQIATNHATGAPSVFSLSNGISQLPGIA